MATDAVSLGFVGPDRAANLEKSGALAIRQLIGCDDLLSFPTRPDGSPAMMLQTQSLFTRLLKGEQSLQSTVPSDVGSAQKDLAKLNLCQLVQIHCSSLDSRFTSAQSSHVSFTNRLKECFLEKLAERLAVGPDAPAAADLGKSMGRVLTLYGAHQSLPDSKSDWWFLVSQGKRYYLQASGLQMSLKAPEAKIMCYDASHCTGDILKWEVFLTNDAQEWWARNKGNRSRSTTPRGTPRGDKSPCGTPRADRKSRAEATEEAVQKATDEEAPSDASPPNEQQASRKQSQDSVACRSDTTANFGAQMSGLLSSETLAAGPLSFGQGQGPPPFSFQAQGMNSRKMRVQISADGIEQREGNITFFRVEVQPMGDSQGAWQIMRRYSQFRTLLNELGPEAKKDSSISSQDVDCMQGGEA